ncbi:hypothetical protein [Ruegeria halocynthiae]|uniref:hypothetical protein n=1 Tax=Ruegeria halocynthiae TaxID=985054 RepID=UPI000562EDEC|nr:hypothetical protein [Ruegeria halocynthiae]
MVARGGRRQGFALIVVLSTLSIVALLFAITSSRFLANLKDSEAELILAKRQQENQSLAELALGVFSQGPTQTDPRESLVIRQDNRELTLVLQDVGGLVDLNTAAPDLLDALSASLSFPSDAVERFRKWRRTPYRLHSVSDFARVAGLPYEDGLLLRQYATVHSGRYGIAPDLAPQELVEQLMDSAALGSVQGAELPPSWRTASSGVVFRLDLYEGGRFERFVGVIHLGGSGSGGRILELY